MSSHVVTQPMAGRLRGGTWRYAEPNAAGAGASKFRENLRRLGGEDLLPADRTAGAAADGTAATQQAPAPARPAGRRPGRPRTLR